MIAGLDLISVDAVLVWGRHSYRHDASAFSEELYGFFGKQLLRHLPSLQNNIF